MGKGYAEGPAAEAAEEERERRARGERSEAPRRARLGWYGCTADDPTPHLLGLKGEVDADGLFARGEAWGLSLRPVR